MKNCSIQQHRDYYKRETLLKIIFVFDINCSTDAKQNYASKGVRKFMLKRKTEVREMSWPPHSLILDNTQI